MLAPTFLNLVLLTLSFTQLSTSTCYDYNGKQQSSEWEPCISDSGAVSTCCATKRQNPFGGAPDKNGQNSDRCLSNGLCQNQMVYKPVGSEDVANITTYFRNGCTAERPDDKWCLNKVCASAGNKDWGGSAEMTPCDGTPDSKLWCCGRTKDCCGKDTQWELPTKLGDAVPALGRIVATLSTPPSSPPSTSSSPPSPNSTSPTQDKSTASPSPTTKPAQNQPPLSAGAIAGITLACVIALGAILAIIFLKRRWDAKRAHLEDKVVKAREAQEKNQEATYEYWGQRLDTRSPPLEMCSASDKIYELHSEPLPLEIGLDAGETKAVQVKGMV